MLLTIGIGGSLMLSRNQPPPDRPAATIGLGANVIIQTPTPGATPVSTSAITETSTVNADRCTPPLFAETFDDPDSGLPHGEQDDSRWGYADGAYQLLISVANKMQTRLIGPPLTDYDATVEAHFASDNLGSYGLVAGARAAPTDYYALMIDGDQTLRHYAPHTSRRPSHSRLDFLALAERRAGRQSTCAPCSAAARSRFMRTMCS